MRVVLLAFIIFNAVYLLATVSKDLPVRDSGFFQYGASKIIQGEMLYRDLWDHKPPLIFYINSLALFLSNSQTWGIWILELFTLSGASFLSYLILKDKVGVWVAFVVTMLWLVSFYLISQGGNYPEEFGLLLQFLAIFLILRERYLLLLGVIFALAILLKPTLIGIFLAIFIYKLKYFKQILTGLGLVFLTVSVYFFLNGSLGDFWNQVIVYNLLYGGQATLGERIDSLRYGLGLLQVTWIFVLAFLAWFFFLFKKNKLLLKIAVLAFPLDLILAILPGRQYPHYFMSVLPPAAILVAFLFFALKNYFFKFFLLGLILISIFPIKFLFLSAKTVGNYNPHENEVVKFIKEETNKDDFVLMWGAETVFNFVTKRPTPGRFAHQYALFTKGYQSDFLIYEFLDDLKTRKPKLIIDTSATDTIIPSITCFGKIQYHPSLSGYDILPSTQKIFEFICDNYSFKKVIWEGWVVYEYNGSI